MPIPLRREMDVDLLMRESGCDALHLLGSFRPGLTKCLESCIVKTFKDCAPVCQFQPHVSDMCRFYSELAVKKLDGTRVDWVLRVLASGEKKTEDSRPMELLSETLRRKLGADSAAEVFFKSESRPSMRSVGRLSGPDALAARIKYVLQDLFVIPQDLGGTVLLVDDIYNLGASMRVYARALKQYGGVERVIGVNLAATRFRGGEDGLDELHLDTSALAAKPMLGGVWLDASGIFHSTIDCNMMTPPASRQLRFMAEKNATACQACVSKAKNHKWWRFGW